MQYREYLARELTGICYEEYQLPKGYHLVGHVALLHLNFDDLFLAKKIAETTLGYDNRIRSVAIRSGPTTHEIRKPAYKLLAGNPNTLTTHIENDVKFRIDPLRITFSGGNKEERISLSRIVKADEFVVDMFACVGQFGLHIAKSAGAKVLALEINPEAYSLLLENIRINHIEDRVQAILGDCRKTHPTAVANRIIMGYLPGTMSFLPSAMETLTREGGVIHMHESLPQKSLKEYCNTISTIAEKWGFCTEIQPRKIKHYSPGIVHYVFDIIATPLSSSKA
jgi:tRNA wybutosine-synthesizing protein 2